ncbi:alpha/beta fold hydrolase [Streptomyces sp. DH37]|uniref:alpha/beta fold hydrolase n=1 Tax=Streptomyces sp. DH37 TaxID=3040122 RepID=UPI00244264B1|nr:alpha/beta fold hydrolase [Streptomyces sp. DH37]MDG9704644.1 alpha/beta fold hydrolase [Streptomyces sp. DH37]
MHATGRQTHAVRWDEAAGHRVRSLYTGGNRPRGTQVVMIPGLGALGYLTDTLEGCGAWARSFLLDVPGFGHRQPRACPARIPALAEAVSAWLAAVPREPVVLVGHSTGAQIALRVAADHPGRVRSLVLMGPTFPPALRRVPGLLGALPRTLVHESAGEIGATVPYYVRGGMRELLRYVRSALHDAPERTISRVVCPTLVLRGEHDALAPEEWALRLAATAAHGRAETVPGAHNFPYGHGGLTAALIAEAARHR